MISRYLTTRLILPLLSVSLLFLWAAYRNSSDLMLNLSSELIGIIVTVVYVDSILRRHEEIRAQETIQPAIDRIKKVVYTFSGNSLTGIYSIILPKSYLESDSLPVALPLLTIETIAALLEGTPPNTFERLINLANSTLNSTNEILSLFKDYLPPEVLGHFIELRSSLTEMTRLRVKESVPEDESIVPLLAPAFHTQRTLSHLLMIHEWSRPVSPKSPSEGID